MKECTKTVVIDVGGSISELERKVREVKVNSATATTLPNKKDKCSACHLFGHTWRNHDCKLCKFAHKISEHADRCGCSKHKENCPQERM